LTLATRRRAWAVLGLFSTGSLGCALNVSEARPARALKGGEVEASYVNNVVVPVGVLGSLIRPARRLGESETGGEPLSEEEEVDSVLTGTALAVQGPGYGTHMEAGVGLGYQYDLALRLGNGIYAAALRRGFDLGNWDASVGTRQAYNSGTSWVPYAEELNALFRVGQIQRLDSQLFTQIGSESGDWLRWWLGAKGMLSIYSLDVDTTRIGIPFRDEVKDHVWYLGPFVGLALGYRYVFFVSELMVLRSWGDAKVGGFDVDVGGVLVAPSFGARLTF